MHTLLMTLSLFMMQAPPPTLPLVRKTIQTIDGKTIDGRVLGEGMSDLQMLTDDQRVHLIRKMDGGRYREVTSQKDWPSYNSDMNGNRYTTLTQIDKSNISRL